ncbi:MAG TPA: type I 3-dehydroquinate dehydratase [Thermoanaerobaculia bacterium]|nr:type I 3-dehydroquinate dehydratase [Thermoanaerobaculia bacterium]
MKVFLTVCESSIERAKAAVATASSHVDGIELRVDPLGDGPIDLREFRELTKKTMLLTRRSLPGLVRPFDAAEAVRALEAGFDLVDAELGPALDRELVATLGNRLVISHHDFEGVGDPAGLLEEMRSLGAAHLKIAATPNGLGDNQRLLELLVSEDRGAPWFVPRPGERSLSVIGMGPAGLYSRILAPFFGSEMIFAARDADSIAAPGQQTLDDVLALYGEQQALPWPAAIFALVGNPASHSRSPILHNARFRSSGVAAAYSILEVSDFDDVAIPFASDAAFAPIGMSVTSPFKETAFTFAGGLGAEVRPNAAAARSVNTLVRIVDGKGSARFVADNTDVDGFEAILKEQAASSEGRTATILGAGGTARAAAVALSRSGYTITICNRSRERGERVARELGAMFLPREQLGHVSSNVIINTLPSSARLDLPSRLLEAATVYVEASYGDAGASWMEPARSMGLAAFDGLQLLLAQAPRQSELFIEAARHAIEKRRRSPGPASAPRNHETKEHR